MPARFKDVCLDARDHRMHVDVTGDSAELITLGATLVRGHDDDIEWDVLADPEGNEFRVFTPRA
jgi:Glyoxalase-like domain